jgi:NAD(P) transhydrogenase subunit alpha
MTVAPDQMLTVGVLREQARGEQRVGLTPDSTGRLLSAGYRVVVEQGAGQQAWFSDSDYAAAGATVGPCAAVLDASDVVVCLHPSAILHALSPKHIVVGLLQPLLDPQLMLRMAEAGVTALSFDMLPRTVSRAQSMDALTSQASVAGYKAALVAADAYGGFFPMLTTAAGTTKPATVLVLGAGVAGLQAIATTRRLGAVVSAFDVRDSAQSDIRSLGATVLDVGVTVASEGGYARQLTAQEQADLTGRVAAAVERYDVLITTAQVPGRPPPLLVPADALSRMRAGSVVVDGAAGDFGGNVEGSVADSTVTTDGGVTVIGAGNLAAQVPRAASTAYARNVAALIAYFTKDGGFAIDLDDEVQAGLVITHGGRVVHPAVRTLLEENP